jgi:hypothetical protein
MRLKEHPPIKAIERQMARTIDITKSFNFLDM